MSSALRVLSDFGDAAGRLIAALVLFAYGRRIIKGNEKAHAALDAKMDTVAQALGTIAKDVSFLAGRQAERDRTAGR